jgi:hypothetical protein
VEGIVAYTDDVAGKRQLTVQTVMCKQARGGIDVRRSLSVLALIVIAGGMATSAGAWYPSTAQVEFATSTW